MYALEPGELAKVTMAKHDGKDDSPFCLVKAMSIRQQSAFGLELDATYEDLNTPDQFYTNIKMLFCKYVISWHGYQSDDAEDAFSKEGMVEILRRMVAGYLVSYEEKKS